MEQAANEARVGVVSGPLSGPVLGRVVGMLTARADCPIDRLDDALLVADAVAASAGSFSEDGRIRVHVVTRAGFVELHVGPLRPGGADDLVAAAALPGVGNVLERVADVLERQERNGDGEYLLIGLGFEARRAA
jgi:serine/threonine-protein kinase RsbW